MLALTRLSSTLIFTGSTGTLEFAYAQSVSENYSEIFHSLVATVDYGGGNVVTKEIALPASGYAAADFSAHGTDILFTNHPTS